MAINAWTSTAPFAPFGLTVSGNNLYGAYNSPENISIAIDGILKQISLANPSNTVNVHTYPIINNKRPTFIASDNRYIYINNNGRSIDRYEIASPNIYVTDWYTTDPGNEILSLTVVGNKLFFFQYNDRQSSGGSFSVNIYLIDLTLPTVTEQLFFNITGSPTVAVSVYAITNDGTYLYFENLEFEVINEKTVRITTYISRLNSTNSNDYLPKWVQFGQSRIIDITTNPSLINVIIIIFGLTVAGGYLYVETSINNNIISNPTIPTLSTITTISLTNPSGDINLNWLSYTGGGFGLTNDGTYLYVANLVQQTISRFPLLVASNICFPAGTPIKTDQGIINIERLQPGKHTIRTKPIEHVTQTVTLDKYLIAFEPSAVDYNVPTKKTIMTKDHCIAFKGKLVPAYRFLDHSDRVKKVTYSGEVLYNVLLAEHGVMDVNNMLCETLHPANLIAKIYKGLTNKHEHFNGKNQLTLQEKEIVKSKSLVGRLQQ